MISDYLSPDYTEIHHNRQEKIDIEEAKRRVFGIRNTYPDFQVTVNQQIAEGDWVVPAVSLPELILGNG